MCLIKLGSYNTLSYAESLFFIMIVYIADGASGLQIIDVSDPYFPVFLDSINPHPNSKIEKCIVQKNN